MISDTMLGLVKSGCFDQGCDLSSLLRIISIFIFLRSLFHSRYTGGDSVLFRHVCFRLKHIFLVEYSGEMHRPSLFGRVSAQHPPGLIDGQRRSAKYSH